jgi:hypothetical protein
MVTVSRNNLLSPENWTDRLGGGVIDAQSCSMERRWRGGAPPKQTFFSAVQGV